MMNRPDAIRGATALTAPAPFGPHRSRAQGGDSPRPDATIRYVVPFPAGGLTDQMARQIGQQLGERRKVNLVVDNRPGGNAQIGAAMVTTAAPAGHTLLAVTLAHAANVTLFPKAPFSLQKDLRPVALIAGSPILIVV